MSGEAFFFADVLDFGVLFECDDAESGVVGLASINSKGFGVRLAVVGIDREHALWTEDVNGGDIGESVSNLEGYVSVFSSFWFWSFLAFRRRIDSIEGNVCVSLQCTKSKGMVENMLWMKRDAGSIGSRHTLGLIAVRCAKGRGKVCSTKTQRMRGRTTYELQCQSLSCQTR